MYAGSDINDDQTGERGILQGVYTRKSVGETDGERLVFYGGMVDETACGAMTAELQGVTLVIHSIYVAPGYRGLGVATELLFTLEDMAHLYYIPSIRVDLLEDPEGEAGLQKLLQTFTTNIKETGNVQYEFDGTQVNWEKLHLRKQISNCCVTLEDCDEALRQQVITRMEGASRCYVPLPFRAQNYDAKHSMIYWNHSGIPGILLMHRTEDGIYVAALMSKLIRIPPRRELTEEQKQTREQFEASGRNSG